MRYEIYDFLVAWVLYSHTQQGESLTLEAVRSYIEKDFTLSRVPILHLENATGRLIRDGLITEKKGERFVLAESKRDDLGQKSSEYGQLKGIVLSQLRKSLISKIPDLDDRASEKIINSLYYLLGSTFARYGVLSAKVLCGSSSEIKSLKEYPGFQQLYQEVVATLPQKCRKEIESEFADFFFNPSQELSRFFFSMAQSYVLIEVLNVDPELKRIEHSAWAKKRIYVDTNILVELLFVAHEVNKSVDKLVRASHELGAKLIISGRTRAEFESWLSSRKSESSRFLALPPNLQEAAADTMKDNPFFGTYQIEQKSSGQAFEGFCLKYNNYLDLLKNRYGFQLDDRPVEIEQEEQDTPKLRDIVSRLTPGKSDIVASHDIYNILAVREMRKTEDSDEAGPNVWFLTSDSSLMYVEAERFGEDDVPASISTDAWFQLIAPFVSPTTASDDAATAFAVLLASNLSTSRVGSGHVAELMSVFMDDKDFTVEQFRRIIGDDHVKSSIARLKQGIEKGETDDKLAEVARPMLVKIKSELKLDQETRIAALTEAHTAEMQQINATVNELKNSHATEKQKIGKEIEGLKIDMTKLDLQKKAADSDRRIYKIQLILTAAFAIVDFVLFFYFLNVLGFGLAGITAGEVIVVLGLPAFVRYSRTKKASKARPSWLMPAISGAIGAIAVTIVGAYLAPGSIFIVPVFVIGLSSDAEDPTADSITIENTGWVQGKNVQIVIISDMASRVFSGECAETGLHSEEEFTSYHQFQLERFSKGIKCTINLSSAVPGNSHKVTVTADDSPAYFNSGP